MKSLLSLAWLGVFGVLLSPAFAGEPLKIGVAGSHSGDLAPYGLPAKHAVELAVSELNQKGGLLGRAVELIALDDVCKPETATNVASKMVSEKVVAVIGHICSSATKAALSIYREANILVISPSATSPELTLEHQNPLFFRTIPHDARQAILQAQFAVEALKVKTAAVVHDKGDYGKGLALLVEQELRARGVEVLLVEGVTPGAQDYSALIRKIGRANPDLIAYGGYHPEASKIVAQARKKGIKSLFISGDGIKDPSFLKIGRQHAEGYYATSPSDLSLHPLNQKVTDQLKAKGQVPGNFGLQAHAAFSALAHAIEEAKSTDPQKIKAELLRLTTQTTLGPISFDANGDLTGAGFAVYQVQKGEFVDLHFSPKP
ncbi:MAG: branched chain amino acid ABC transporter substrate-binding protein [Candidatus Lambdaproteobacteria bacterium RIFOXYD2_FULL_50_16]|uniref:Branched chain amino acid ABC transporter substrate-binding protein n=1 Tax=Candidatus Lambdaproteobacteria bacterium RIFOXYD2_FULL_50_16 TaxID=1817772 RepID=A0A1F6G826_9PROT|nr:MAG: branched chain amino acid ABC transporter substrate-binding protein [Candidatus Lambdaproteobacteria bacterium RIFOXYD2_FULL_50_16]